MTPTGGNWAGNGIITGTSTFDPAQAGTGNDTLVYTVTDSIGCQGSDSMIITINPTPTANAGNDIVVCNGNPEVLKKVCPGIYGTIKPIGICMIGKR